MNFEIEKVASKKMGLVEINTPLDFITIRTKNHNLLEQQVIESLADAYERGVSQAAIMNALNSL